VRSATLSKLAIALAIVGVLALVVAIAYFLVPTGKLPSVLGRVANGKGHHDKRAIAALAAGVLLVIGALASFVVVRNRRRRHSFM
jgi:hypothetical protein